MEDLDFNIVKIDYKTQDNLDQIILSDFLPFPHTISVSREKSSGDIWITTGQLHTTEPLHVERQALAMQQAAMIARDFEYRWVVYASHPDLVV